MKKLFELIQNLIASEFFGELRIKFQKGRVSHIEKEESIDVSQMR